MIAGEGDQQQARQVSADQPVQPIGGGKALLAVQSRAVRDQQTRASGVRAVMSCGAHVRNIASTQHRLHP